MQFVRISIIYWAICLVGGMFCLNAFADDKPTVVFDQVENNHGLNKMQGVEQRAAALITEALNRCGRFNVLDSRAISDLEGVDHIISGEITGDDLVTEITLKFIHPTHGRVSHSLQVANITTPHIWPLARKLYNRFLTLFPLNGRIIQIKASRVYVNLGAAHGLKAGDKLVVFQVEEIKDGETVIDREQNLVGELTLQKVLQNSAWGDYRSQIEARPPEVGLLVESAPPVTKRAASASHTLIAISQFKNMEGDKRLDYMGEWIRESLTTHLTGLEGYSVVERGQLDKILDEQRLSSSRLFDPLTTSASGQLWGADFVVGGSFIKTADGYRLDGRVVALDTGRILVAESISTSDLLEATDQLIEIIRHKIGAKAQNPQ